MSDETPKLPRKPPIRRGGWAPPGEKETARPAAPKPPAPAPRAAAFAPPREKSAPREASKPAPPKASASDFRPPTPRRKVTEPPRRSVFRVPSRLHSGTGLISRGERALFWGMLAAVVAMGIFLLRYRERVREHFASRETTVPLSFGGANAVAAPMTLVLANDDSGALVERSLMFPLPSDPNTRARVLLEKLLTEYAEPRSLHPLHAAEPGAPAIDQVFLLPVPGAPPHSEARLAVVDLSGAFVHTHPSGIEPETLTLLSIIATLHANLPDIAQVHFLVDGEPRATLAGHADLLDTYLTGASPVTGAHNSGNASD